MLNFCDFVLDIKGEKALQRLPRLSDLTAEDMECLKEGYIQLLPDRDRSGRRVVALVDNFGLKTSYRIRVSRKKVDGLFLGCA